MNNYSEQTIERKQSEAPSPKQSIAGKYIYTLIMFLIEVVIIAMVVIVAVKNASYGVLLLAIPLNLIYGIICFTVKKGVRGLMIWWGILAMLSVVWWTYLIIANQ